jgi:hypothetical protein
MRSLHRPFAFTAALLLCLAAPVMAAERKAPYTGPDFSGVYECRGEDSHEGRYTSTVTLELVKAQSVGKYAAYTFKMEVPGYGSYPGHVAANGLNAAIYFALNDSATKDYGTGIAQFSRKGGKWQFNKYYYEPEFKGGNYGTETCLQK